MYSIDRGAGARMTQYGAANKSAAIAYLLWFLQGTFGAHRFYLNLRGTGVVLLTTALSSFLFMSGYFGQTFARVGYVTIWIPVIWAFVDLLLIPGLNRKHNAALATRLGGDTAEPGAIERMKPHQQHQPYR